MPIKTHHLYLGLTKCKYFNSYQRQVI